MVSLKAAAVLFALGVAAASSAQSPLLPAKPPAQAQAPADARARALDLLKAGKAAEAAELFQQAVNANPRDIQSLVNLAGAYEQLRRWDDAVATYRKAIAVNPSYQPFYTGLGFLLLDAGRNADAYVAFEDALRRDATDSRARLGEGASLDRLHRYSEAAGIFRQALGYAPDSAAVHESLGNVYEETNDHEAALNEYEAALTLEPTSTTARLGKAGALASLKRLKEAEAVIAPMVSKNPTDAPTLSSLAQVYDSGGDHARAIDLYKRALKSSPSDAIMWGNLGWACYGAKDYPAAEQATRKSLELDPSLTYARFNLGLYLAAMNRGAESMAVYREGIKKAARAEMQSALDDLAGLMARAPSAAVQSAIDLVQTAVDRDAGLPG